MTRTKVKRLTALGGAAALCFGVAAQAGTEQEVFSESFTVANIGSFKNIDVPQFDPQGGCRELLKVTLEAEGVGTGDYAFTNDSDTLCTGAVTINYGATVTFPFPSGPPPILECSQFDSVGPIPILLNPDETLDLPDLIDFQFSCMDMTDPGEDLTPFIGMGTIVARYDGDQDTDSEVDCDFTESLDTNFTGSITITYEYQPNPPECTIEGPLSLCPGDQDVQYTVTVTPPDQPVDIVWDIQGDAVFCEPPAGGETAFVCADAVCGSFTLTVTVTDPDNPAECFGECTLTVLLEDEVPPTITCPPDITIGCKDPTGPSNTGFATCEDNCGTLGDPTFSDVVSGQCPKTIERTWTCTDLCGLTVSCLQIITVTDDIPPMLMLPPDVKISCKDDSSPAGTGQATAGDNCTPDGIQIGFNDDTSGNCPVIVERTWFAIDKCGNQASGVQIITINDDIPPVLTVPPDVKIDCKDDFTPSGTGQATAEDNCSPEGIQITFSNQISGNCPVLITRTWTATDKCGNSVSADQLILINDEIAPELILPPDVKISCKDDSSPDGTGEPTFNENCSPEGIELTFSDAISGNCPVIIERTWTVTDKCGNASSGVQIITVNDDIPPVLTVPPDVKIDCKDDFTPSGTGEATAEDNCSPEGIQITFSNQIDGNCPVLITRTWTATDKCGNSVSADQLITINDDIAPELILPPNVKITCKDDSSPAETGEPDFNENCSPEGIEITFSDVVTGNCPVIIQRTWTVRDKCANESSGVQIITVNDDIPPVLTVPPDVKISCKQDPSDLDLTGEATAEDNCSPQGIQMGFSDVVSGNCPVLITRTWTATDKCGNTASADQVITLNDDFPPVLTVPPDVKITCKDDSSPANTGEATADDNCDPADPLIGFSDVVSGNCPVVITRTWTATDKCGNQASEDQLITLNDDFPPVITLPPDVKISCKDDSSPANTGEATADDNCDPADPLIGFSDVASGNCPVLLERTWTATDKCGNTASGVQIITVNDDIPPLITCPGPLAFQCPTQVPPCSPGDASATDNCSPPVDIICLPDETNGGTGCPLDPLIITRTYRATDACGNTATCAQTITVIDDVPPSISCPGPLTFQCPDDVPPCDPDDATASDNCGPVDIVCLPDTDNGGSGCPDDPLIITRTYQAIDACANFATCTQEITVVDDTAPVISCPSDPDPLDCDSPYFFSIEAEDNCFEFDQLLISCSAVFTPEGSGTLTDLGDGNFSIVFTVDGTAVVTCTATDPCGNASAACTFNVEAVCTECDLRVGLQGCVILPPPTGDACEGKVTSLTLQYTGEGCSATSHTQDPSKVSCEGDAAFAEPVDILVSNGGSEVYADVTGVLVGEEIVATADNAGQNDFASSTFVTISDAAGNVLEEIEFHTSCSQPLTPGNQFGSMLVVTMITTEGGEATLPDPDDCVTEFVQTTGDACEGKLTQLVVLYTGEDCSATSTTQDPSKYSCDGDPAMAEDVRIRVTNDNGSEVYADVTGVPLNGVVTATATNAGENEFASESRIKIYSAGGDLLQEITLHTSCSQPLGPGDQFGAMLVMGMTSTNGGTDSLGAEVEYTYTVYNSAPDPIYNVTVVDDVFGEVPGSPIPVVGPGEYVELTLTATITEQTTNTVVVMGELGNLICTAMTKFTITVVEPPQDCCEFGKPRVLTMRYTGDDCTATSHGQDSGKVSCEDFGPLPGLVYILSTDKSNPDDGGAKVWFEGAVSYNETFDIDALNAGESKLANETFIHVFDVEGGTLLQTVKFHTSCSQPLAEGYQFGSALLIGCVGDDEPVPGDCCAMGKPVVLTMEFTGEDCSGTSHSQDSSKVSCEDFGPLPNSVFILSTDKANPDDGGAKVWFEGTANLNGTFDIDAGNAGELKLANETFIHIFDVEGGTLLQTVKFHTSCSQPLFLDDRFGASRIIGCIGEYGPARMLDFCPADLDDDGRVGSGDMLVLLSAWDTAANGPPDLDGDGRVDAGDFLVLLGAWGPCE